MDNFRQYEAAIAMYYSGLNVKTAPIYSWDFHNDFLCAMKSYFRDLNKLNTIASQNKWVDNNWDLKNSLKEEVIVVTDVKLQIVFASHNILAMNGYTAKEVIGKSPKMFQGESTNQIISNEIRIAILEQQPFEKTVMNYKKNGDVYVCLIKGYPVFDRKGQLKHYIAFEKAA